MFSNRNPSRKIAISSWHLSSNISHLTTVRTDRYKLSNAISVHFLIALNCMDLRKMSQSTRLFSMHSEPGRLLAFFHLRKRLRNSRVMAFRYRDFTCDFIYLFIYFIYFVGRITYWRISRNRYFEKIAIENLSWFIIIVLLTSNTVIIV